MNVSADVVIIRGDDIQIEIKAQENLLDVIKTKVRANELVISSSQCIRTSDGIKIEITVPDLSSVMLNGSGSIRTRSVFSADDFEVAINGSGEVAVDVHADDVDAAINGSGEIIVNGSTKELDVVINGSGDFRGLGLVSKDAEVIIRGSGDVYINAQNSLDAEILGSGDIIYIGNPSVNSSVKGSGNILKKD